MREIKFRAKRSDDGAWVYGDLTHVQKICSVEEKNKTGKSTMPVVRVAGYDVDEETVGQLLFTIYHDDGTSSDVYIGDVVSIGLDDGTRELMEIEDFSSSYVEIVCDVIVEGNIHDNPELLDKIAEEYDRRTSTEP